MLRVIVFDVEHGFCAFVKSPTGHTLMIDCGKTSDFSPVNYILKNELGGTVSRNGYRLTKLIVTHPHDDHIEDIASLTSKLAPSILQRQRYDWEAIKEPDASSGEYENLDHYAAWQTKYSEPVKDEPDWGMQIETFCLTPKDAIALDETKYVNNSSMVTIVSFKGTEFTEKFLFGADVEQAGWEALLKRASFKSAVSGTDFFIAPHHGHASGFSTALYEAMGKPILNLVSVHSRDENVDSRYSSKDYAIGVEMGGERRYMLSTRNDGSIFVDVGAEGKFGVHTQNLPANIVKKSW
jgi:beta-lactamase superfamily II metal-dependent hydrolase